MKVHHLFVCVWLAVLLTTSAAFSKHRFRRPFAAAAAPVGSWPVGQYQVPLYHNAFAPAPAPAQALGVIWPNGMRFRRQRPTQRPVNRWRYVHTLYDYEHPDHHHIYHS